MGTQLGLSAGVCETLISGYQYCSWTLDFGNGDAFFVIQLNNEKAAVSGGTGKYVQSRGECDVIPNEDNTQWSYDCIFYA